MALAGVAPARSAHQQTETALPPPKHPLVRSFVHEVTGLFGDLNVKGSKTGIERSIETFELEQPANVLLCLVRAYVVARDTKDEKIRHRRPETGAANRMPLFCSMFKTFARALASESPWEYIWQKMLEDIAADDRLSLWLSEHQVDLAGGESDLAGTTGGPSTTVVPETVEEIPAEGDSGSVPEVLDEGWIGRDEACEYADYLAGELAANEYVGLEIRVRLPKGGTRYQIFVQDAEGSGYRLVCEAHVATVVELARNRTFSTAPESSTEQAEAGD